MIGGLSFKNSQKRNDGSTVEMTLLDRRGERGNRSPHAGTSRRGEGFDVRGIDRLAPHFHIHSKISSERKTRTILVPLVLVSSIKKRDPSLSNAAFIVPQIYRNPFQMDVSTGNKHHPSFVTMDRGAGGPSELHAHRKPSREEMHAVFGMCRQNQWTSVLNCVRSNPWISVTSMIMDNHISTTILHQAITSKGDTKARARVIREILALAPDAAAIKNGYGSLPLHVIAQRNTKMDAATKELLINELVVAYKDALAEEGGVGKRTPLHIIFTGTSRARILCRSIVRSEDTCSHSQYVVLLHRAYHLMLLSTTTPRLHFSATHQDDD